MMAGGEIKLVKCVYTVHEMESTPDGTWEYSDTVTSGTWAWNTQEEEVMELEDLWNNSDGGEDEELEELEPIVHGQVKVPLINRNTVAIANLKSSEAVKNRGLFTRPNKNCNIHTKKLKEKVEDWLVHVKNGNLSTSSVWTSYTHQIWYGMRYGLGACSA